jgi:hypothetical protein
VRLDEQVPRAAARLLVALGAGLACLLIIAWTAGLLTGTPRGASDNGDGIRLYCGAGLVPATADHRSNWVGGVVMDFTRSAPCSDPIPSSALLILRAAAADHPDTWSLTRLGWLYAAVAAGVTALAGWAATAVGLHRVVVLVPALVPLANTDFTRFFLSTFSEPAGLLGAYALLCGVAAAAATSARDQASRIVALALCAGGGLLAATAKAAYLPLLGIAVLLCVLTAVRVCRGGRWRPQDAVPGVVAAAAAVALAVGPVQAALAWQDRGYPAVNAHNVIFTMLLPEAGSAATADTGLPPEAAAHAGFGFYGPQGGPLDPDSIPGWQAAIGDDPAAAHLAALRALAARPAVLATAVGVAMQATRGAAVDYLLERPAPSDAAGPLQIIDSPAMGKDVGWMRAWLGDMTAPWVSSLLAAVGLCAGLVSLRTRGVLAGFARTAFAGAAAAVGLAAVTVLGDGYYEIAKHMWLAAYLLDVTAVAVAGVLVVAVVRFAVRR